MSNPRHALILIGFLAQALTWDNFNFIVLPVILWVFAVKVLRNRIRVSLTSEAILMMAGCAVSIVLNRGTQGSAHFFLGDGLIVLQLVRLARPLSNREKLTSLIIACFHVAVLCTLAPDTRFVLLFGAAVFLFPKALKEVLLAKDDPVIDRWDKPVKSPTVQEFLRRRWFVVPLRVYSCLFATSALAFLALPRFTGTPLQLRDGLQEQGSLLDSILDPRRGGRANSQQVLLQIEGDSIGYLRCFTLNKLDGGKWSADRSAGWRELSVLEAPEELKKYKRRTVFVKNSHYLGNVLPIDGSVVNLVGNFFAHPFHVHDSVECRDMWSTANNNYTYWINPDPALEPLTERSRGQLLWHPPQSRPLERWVEQRTVGATNDLAKARQIERYLRENFDYELGTPELNRINPVEDFIFNQKKGHCERFAAALALFFRMQGIPSRVVIGYVATTRNLFTGRWQVRFRDAHAWTEGYIDGMGWMRFDATPGPLASNLRLEILDLIEALDFAWYVHVVNFNGIAQKDFWLGGVQLAARVPELAWDRAFWLFAAAILLLSMFHFKSRLGNIRMWLPRRRTPAIYAQHSYGRMLALFARAGLPKPVAETPLEFLEELRKRAFPGYDEASVVTDAFCRTAYGEKTLAAETKGRVERALDSLKEALPRQQKHGAAHASQRN